MQKITDLTNEQIGRAFRKLFAGDENRGPVDLDLLHQQKLDIVPLKHDNTDDTLQGLVGFLDTFQDICVDELGIWNFPTDNDQEED